MLRKLVLVVLLATGPLVGYAIGNALWPTRTYAVLPFVPSPDTIHHERCRGLEATYHSAAEALPVACQADDDCLLEERGDPFGVLDGCVRISSRTASRTALASTEALWLDEGCVGRIMHCAPAAAGCREHRCVERARDPLLADWQHVFSDRSSFWLPLDFAEQPNPSEHYYIMRYAKPGAALDVYWDESWPPALDHGEMLQVDGHPGALFVAEDRNETHARLVLQGLEPGFVPKNRKGAVGRSVTFRLECQDRGLDCAALLRRVIPTIRFH